ncbi:MAG: hypothetical protein LBG92_04215 [Prevotellaceae bacterium]|nr:hypothetical protein [Prevotellaceae bacterium]
MSRRDKIFITAGERSRCLRHCESAELARMGKTPQSLLFCPFGQTHENYFLSFFQDWQICTRFGAENM